MTLLLCGAFVAAPVSGAMAQEGADEALEAQFNAQAARAKALYVEGNLEEALEAFKEAYALKPEPNILYNMGRIHEKQGDFEQATVYYEKFANEPDIALPARQDAIARLKALKEVLALREPAEQPDPIEPEPVEPDPVVTAPPIAPPEDTEKPSLALPLTIMGVGAASLITGGVFGVFTGQTHDTFAQTNDLEQMRALKAQGRRQAIIADVGMLAGGALLATGGVLLVLKRRPSDEAGVTLAPAVSPTAQGVRLSLTF
jgi:tetratricopeptide (TPR) repeat protein